MYKLSVAIFLILILAGCKDQPQPLESQWLTIFDISRAGTTYYAKQNGVTIYSGTAKFVIESAVAAADVLPAGRINFSAQTFALGADWLELNDIQDILFQGAGQGLTILRNNSPAATDTEVFDCTGCDSLVIRDMTIIADGPYRSTSDAMDFDGGDFIHISDVTVADSRGRGIVFDGKGLFPYDTADNNSVTSVTITGNVPSHGIELLASSDNWIAYNTITDVDGAGIVINKSSTTAQQPNKPSNNNLIELNHIINAGHDGIRVNSGNDNIILQNRVWDSAHITASRDGIRIQSSDGIACNSNQVTGNESIDGQTVKTQKYGLNISSSLCVGTIVGVMGAWPDGNEFDPNLTGPIKDIGTNTVYQ